jgi:hypothetical protein
VNRSVHRGNEVLIMITPRHAFISMVALAGCSTVISPGSDAGIIDAGIIDAGRTDVQIPDVGRTDARIPDAGCIDRVVNDPANCGACDRACGVNQRCDLIECVCVEGYGACGASTACDTPLRNNPQHCGGCGARCVDGERCADTRCVHMGCVPGFADCEDPATPCETELTRTDSHCGACGNACATGTRCVAGRCVSPAITQQMPGSMLATTSARPWFRWALGSGVDGARLQVCADAPCTRVQLEADVTGVQHRPAVALAEGVHFWRLFARRSAVVDATPTPVWAFVVPPADALGARETPRLLDLNGDGFDDEVIVERIPRRVYSLRIRYGGAARPEHQVLSETTDIELSETVLVRAGDIDGDGLADAVLAVSYVIRSSPTQSDGALRLFDVLGRRDGDPVVLSRADVRGVGHPGPSLELSHPLGNAPGRAGMLTLVGRAPNCAARFHNGVAAPEPINNVPCAGSLLTAGDYNADGRVEVVADAQPRISWSTGETAPTLRDCEGSRTLVGSDYLRRALTADVDADGYDDLVVLPSGAGPRHVIHGGPAALDGARCTDLP